MAEGVITRRGGILDSVAAVGPIQATGGTVTEANGFRIHTFTANGTF